jgi:hypothetical protein
VNCELREQASAPPLPRHCRLRLNQLFIGVITSACTFIFLHDRRVCDLLRHWGVNECLSFTEGHPCRRTPCGVSSERAYDLQRAQRPRVTVPFIFQNIFPYVVWQNYCPFILHESLYDVYSGSRGNNNQGVTYDTCKCIIYCNSTLVL